MAFTKVILLLDFGPVSLSLSYSVNIAPSLPLYYPSSSPSPFSQNIFKAFCLEKMKIKCSEYFVGFCTGYSAIGVIYTVY